MANDLGRVMTEAEQLLRDILEHGDIIGRDAANQTIIQLAVDQTTLDRLMAFGADAAESEDGGDDEPYEGPPMHACWFGAATTRPARRSGLIRFAKWPSAGAPMRSACATGSS